ncbi:MAG: hypothetical protein HYT21_02030 [Candidatus Nealsonbacteria bacterium]|nr:hypothetical protein [Candidatus Nealsonbacteria bacterium]
MKTKQIFFFILILALVAPQTVFGIALNLQYPVPPGAPNINDGNQQTFGDFALYIYNFIVWISGLAAFVMIIWNGFLWLTSAGNPGQIRQATEGLRNAALGLLVVLASFIILQTINPQFIAPRLPTF